MDINGEYRGLKNSVIEALESISIWRFLKKALDRKINQYNIQHMGKQTEK